jgi:hypothetical protein
MVENAHGTLMKLLKFVVHEAYRDDKFIRSLFKINIQNVLDNGRNNCLNAIIVNITDYYINIGTIVDSEQYGGRKDERKWSARYQSIFLLARLFR